MRINQENEMYEPVRVWLEGFLKSRHPRAITRVFNSSTTKLTKLIENHNLMKNLPGEWHSWDIQVDIAGFSITKRKTVLAFVECKINTITLKDLSQLIGYTKVANPSYSFIISPQGPSDSLRVLLSTYGRLDVLEYDARMGELPKSIVVARWDFAAETIDLSTLITGDFNKIGMQI
jgi:hypothetical protein